MRAEELTENKDEFFKGTLCDIIHKTAQRYPDKVAVSAEDHELTYQELDEYSNFLARHLMGLGVRQEEAVAIKTGRNATAILAMLAIWKAGGAYTYLDLSYPESRNRALQEEGEWKITLTEEYLEKLDWKRDTHFLNRARRESLAILVYTSGTTSKPKGVMIEHRNVAASISNFHRLGFCDTDRVCVFPSFSFVASVYDIFSTLSVGATLDIIPEYRRRKMSLITEYYEKRQITVAFLPPHMARKFIKEDSSRFHIRVLIVGSEAVRHLDKRDYRIINVYASSECCSLISAYEVTKDEPIYPIGTLNPTFRGYVVDDAGNPVPPGEEGELWLAGPQVTRGYLKRPELTEKQFIKNPFTSDPEYRRLFKTKDLVRMDADGCIHYIGRKDNMYKIRGFRVEGSAVESAILGCAAIKEVVVKAFPDEGGVNILCGYFVSDTEVDVKDVKEKLKKVLPYFMVPTCLIRVDEFPRNFNNKIDRKAIKPPKEINDHKLLEKLY